MLIFDNTYTSLPNRFYSTTEPAHFSNPSLIIFNTELAEDLNINLDQLSDKEKAEYFCGEKIFDNSAMISMAYSGHQFGHFNPTLGDGRAILIGEVKNDKKERFDIQLKGAGPSVFSRRGDGFSSLGPVLREYLVSEAMFHLGVPTTRALCAVTTGDQVYREDILPGGVLTRVASSHIRIGTFEYFASRNDIEGLKRLTDYAIDRHYPEVKHSREQIEGLISAVAQRWAYLVAKWMSLGFIHGVMNTDNMAISGETIDFGPCAFMDTFKENQVYSFIDRNGRYAYNNQINIAKWNLSRFVSCLLPLLDQSAEKAVEKGNDVLQKLYPIYDEAWLRAMSSKLGIEDPLESDVDLIHKWLGFLENNQLDFTNSFYKLTYEREFFKRFSEFEDFEKLRIQRISDKSLDIMTQNNPRVIPRNHLIEEVIQQGISGKFEKFKELHQVLMKPYGQGKDETPPPTQDQIIQNTFCGT